MDFLTLFISLQCTQACAHCIYGCSPERGEHMSLDVFEKSLAIAKEKRIPAVNFFGGEPLLNPQIFPMLKATLEEGLSLMLATNCRPLVKEPFLDRFLELTKPHREHIVVITARDRFHSKFFDPLEVIERLRREEYSVTVQDYSDYRVIITGQNDSNQELHKLNTDGSCCEFSWKDHLGVLPDGRWTICPPSLEAFGNIFTNGLEQLVEFKRGLPLQYQRGCTECLKDFKIFRQQFEASEISRKLIT